VTPDTEPTEQAPLSLKALLLDYELARGDERNLGPLYATLLAGIVSAIGLLALALLQSKLGCVTGTASKATTLSTTCTAPQQFLLVSFLIVPLAGLSIAALAAMVAAARSHYLRALEARIRQASGLEKTELAYRAIRFDAVSWTSVANTITGARSGQSVYRLIIWLLFLGTTGIYIGMAVLIGTHLSRWSLAVMTMVLLAVTILLVGAIVNVTVGDYPFTVEAVNGQNTRDLLRPSLDLTRYLLWPQGRRRLAWGAASMSVGVVLLMWAIGKLNLFRAGAGIGLAVAAEISYYALRQQVEDLRRRWIKRETFQSRTESGKTTARFSSVGIIVLRATAPILVIGTPFFPVSVTWKFAAALGVLLLYDHRGTMPWSAAAGDGVLRSKAQRLLRAPGVSWLAASYAARGLVIWQVAILLHARSSFIWAGLVACVCYGAAGMVYASLRNENDIDGQHAGGSSTIPSQSDWAERLSQPRRDAWRTQMRRIFGDFTPTSWESCERLQVERMKNTLVPDYRDYAFGRTVEDEDGVLSVDVERLPKRHWIGEARGARPAELLLAAHPLIVKDLEKRAKEEQTRPWP
jgi:hypothetical protein